MISPSLLHMFYAVILFVCPAEVAVHWFAGYVPPAMAMVPILAKESSYGSAVAATIISTLGITPLDMLQGVKNAYQPDQKKRMARSQAIDEALHQLTIMELKKHLMRCIERITFYQGVIITDAGQSRQESLLVSPQSTILNDPEFAQLNADIADAVKMCEQFPNLLDPHLDLQAIPPQPILDKHLEHLNALVVHHILQPRGFNGISLKLRNRPSHKNFIAAGKTLCKNYLEGRATITMQQNTTQIPQNNAELARKIRTYNLLMLLLYIYFFAWITSFILHMTKKLAF